MYGRRKYDELDNLWDAYLSYGELGKSEDFKKIKKELFDYFKLLVANKLMTETKFLDIEDNINQLIGESANQAFRYGFVKGMDIKYAVVKAKSEEIRAGE